MKIISARSFVTSPWKNGGGITHEIAKQHSGDSFDWRLSVAEVERDGAFSLFSGCQRCLTVIAGHGMMLERNGGNLAADVMAPVWFSGNDEIYGRLRNGPCRDFNLIYDASRFSATVHVMHHNAGGIADARNGFYVVEGCVASGDDLVSKGDFAFFDCDEPLKLSADASLLVVSLVAKSQ